ncbi:helix-turn-helix domain-containing protein [Nakamurella alba]|nr:helix-turn-helix domain-containing protein [Nakamurella alba]
MPSELSDLLRKILVAIAAGRTISVGPLQDELTTSAAAQMLGISRPTLMKLIRSNTIPAHKVGTHTRIRMADALAYRRDQLQAQEYAFAELRAMEDELGLT